MFVVILKYLSPLEEIDRWMSEHMRFLRRHYRNRVFIASGRQIPRKGGVILARAPDRQTLEAIMKEDPFCRQGVAEVEIIEFSASQHDPDFKTFLN